MAEQVIGSDQSFVWHEDLRSALHEIGDARRKAKEAGVEDYHEMLPPDDSLICRLWRKHWGALPKKTKRRSKGEEEELLTEVRKITDAIERAERNLLPRPRWPCP